MPNSNYPEGPSGPGVPTVTTDELRARELYKYFRPPANDGESPDPTLTAHAQLVAWRLGAERSMITLIDEHIQYFVAESTKTLYLDNTNKHDHPDDAIWAGCVRVSKAGRLCEHTIAASPPQSGGPACFEVLDLGKDDRFNNLDFVTGAPHFKNYAGVPLRTRKGINIGSIFVIDSRIRPALDTAERHFLGVVADNVVRHLEMLKDRQDCERGLNMSACISAYIDPLHRSTRPSTRNGVRRKHAFLAPSQVGATDVDHDEDERGRLGTYRRAADLLLKGLDYDESGGGVMFLDTLPVGRKSKYGVEETTATSSSQEESDEDAPAPTNPPTPSDRKRDWIQDAGPAKEVLEINATEILAQATQPDEISRPEGCAAEQVEALPPDYLSKLIKRFPDGKLFTFNFNGHAMTSSSDETSKVFSPPRSSKSHTKDVKRHETAELRRCFPSARQIIFLPIWDSSTSRWAICIAYHRSKFRHLSYKSDFVYCATFGNAIIAELTKLTCLQADQQKSDFIASISHELRSPLHGVLASCEFLEDTELSQFQQSMIDTATSCSRTLLDTINMVLDYSNINRFEKMKDSRKARRDLSADSRSKVLQTSLSTQRTVDVAALLEEVIDGVIAGHAFEDRLKNRGSISSISPQTMRVERDVPVEGNNVKLILDIAVQNYTYFSEPGALRRIVMNIVENAIKFTKDGFVHVTLQSNNPKDSSALGSITLTVADSGQGISPAYLRNTVFTPFSQESDLTGGSGLGLSLVKSIVRNMGGRISIESAVGEGTSVTVRLPMIREPSTVQSRDSKVDSEHFDNAAERNRSTRISAVRDQVFGKTATFNWHQSSNDLPWGQRKALRLLQASLMSYLSRWFGLSVCPWQKGHTYDIVISTFDGLEAFKQSAPESFTTGCQHVVVCTTAMPSPVQVETFNSGNIWVLGCPFGPARLSQVLKNCLGNLVSDKGSLSEALHESDTGGLPSNHLDSPSVEEVSTVFPSSLLREAQEQQNADQGVLIDDVDVEKVSMHVTSEPIDLNPPPNYENFLPPGSLSLEASQSVRETTHVDPGYDPSKGSPLTILSHGPAVTVTLSGSLSTQTPAQEWTKTPAAGSEPENISPRMLLVEDNVINLRLLQVYTKKLGYKRVHSAENGLIAAQTYERLLNATPSMPPNIILMDLSMPVMNGFEATRQIRKSENEYAKQIRHTAAAPRSFIVALTGLSSLKDQKEAFAAGVDRYIMKPVNFKKLSLLLEMWQSGSSHDQDR
ncbi:hypothetical protein PMIN03_005827 [Paraphaeosphaeria minitans]